MPFFANHQMQMHADFSADGIHRLWLSRRWSRMPLPLVVMCNPSKASEKINDPTVSFLCRYFASRPQYGGFIVGNWTTYRATDPADMVRWLSEPSPMAWSELAKRNLKLLHTLAKEAPIVVVAWGNLIPSDMASYTGMVLSAISDHGRRPLYAFGLTNGGEPKHPMARGKHRLLLTDELVPYNPAWQLKGWQ